MSAADAFISKSCHPAPANLKRWLADVEPDDRSVTFISGCGSAGCWSKGTQLHWFGRPPKGRCVAAFPTLINFLTCHTLLPSVTSSTLCLWRCSKVGGGSLNPLSSMAWAWPGLASPSCQPDCCLKWLRLCVSVPTLESFFPCLAPCSRAGIWLTCIAWGYARRLLSLLCRPRLPGEAGGAGEQLLDAPLIPPFLSPNSRLYTPVVTTSTPRSFPVSLLVH